MTKTDKSIQYPNGLFLLVVFLIIYKRVIGQSNPPVVLPQGILMDDVSYFTSDGGQNHGNCYELLQSGNPYIYWNIRGSSYLQADR
jgi:hypothetical protein